MLLYTIVRILKLFGKIKETEQMTSEILLSFIEVGVSAIFIYFAVYFYKLSIKFIKMLNPEYTFRDFSYFCMHLTVLTSTLLQIFFFV